MNIYDFLMLGLLALIAWGGFRRGFVRELAGLAAFALGLLLALRFAGPLGRWLVTVFSSLSLTSAHVIAFFLIVLLTGIAIDVVASLVTGAIRRVPIVGGLDRAGGLLVGIVLGLFGVWLLTTCLVLLPPSLLPFTTVVRHSQVAQLVHSVQPSWLDSLRTRPLGL